MHVSISYAGWLFLDSRHGARETLPASGELFSSRFALISTLPSSRRDTATGRMLGSRSSSRSTLCAAKTPVSRREARLGSSRRMGALAVMA